MSMPKIDKIIQIVKGDEKYTIHALSESGKLYALIVNGLGQYSWKSLLDSPYLGAE